MQKEEREYVVYPSNLDVWGAFNEFREYLKENGWSDNNKSFQGEGMFIIEVNPRRRFNSNDFDEFLKLLKKYPYSIPIVIWKSVSKEKRSFNFQIRFLKAKLEVHVSSQDLDLISAIHEKIRECFQASNPDHEHVDKLSKTDLKKSIFIAHRFDTYTYSIAHNLNKFLRCLGFDVKEGSGYEAKDIPDKVRDKIASQDIFICLVTPGDTTWITGEAAYAKALHKYVIFICQEKVDYKKGIIGEDYEHLVFPVGIIEKCFTDLASALPV